MKLSYDVQANALLIELRAGTYATSDEVAPGMIVDFDEQGQPLRIEILNVRDHLHQVASRTLSAYSLNDEKIALVKGLFNDRSAAHSARDTRRTLCIYRPCRGRSAG